jgi:hypothetical protein
MTMTDETITLQAQWEDALLSLKHANKYIDTLHEQIDILQDKLGETRIAVLKLRALLDKHEISYAHLDGEPTPEQPPSVIFK